MLNILKTFGSQDDEVKGFLRSYARLDDRKYEKQRVRKVLSEKNLLTLVSNTSRVAAAAAGAGAVVGIPGAGNTQKWGFVRDKKPKLSTTEPDELDTLMGNIDEQQENTDVSIDVEEGQDTDDDILMNEPGLQVVMEVTDDSEEDTEELIVSPQVELSHQETESKLRSPEADLMPTDTEQYGIDRCLGGDIHIQSNCAAAATLATAESLEQDNEQHDTSCLQGKHAPYVTSSASMINPTGVHTQTPKLYGMWDANNDRNDVFVSIEDEDDYTEQNLSVIDLTIADGDTCMSMED